LTDEGLGNSSYLVDVGGGRAMVVDPQRDATPYLAAAERLGLSIAYSVETHLHADFLTGSRELAAGRAGAAVLAPAGAQLEWPHRGFGHGDETGVGDGLTLRALATPGHTPEHVSWLLLDGDRPAALFSGGALIVGSVARTDLVAPDQTEPLARALWRALHDTVLTLPDDVGVYPTHGAGSFCSASETGRRTTTIGDERAHNPLLAARDEDEFVSRLLGGYGTYPPYFLRLRPRNRRGPEVLGSPFPALAPLAARDVQRMVERDGAVVVDARPSESWTAGHVQGSVSIALRPQFATWLGWLLPDDRPLVFVLDDDQDGADLVRQARTIGYDRLAGTLAGGVAAWRDAGLPVVSTERVDAERFEIDRLVLDVRQADEHAHGHLPGAIHIELGDLPRRTGDVPPAPLVTMCGRGDRAASAASILERAGRHDVAVAAGGPPEWERGPGRHLFRTR
jgi:hydroxyacylglutathione hydrolase